MIMKSLIKAVAVAAVLAIPALSFAQSNQPVTRAQVRAELIQLEKAGYNPAESDQTTYPVELQAAEARVAANNAKAQNSGYGASTNGSSQSGQHGDAALSNMSRPVFEHH
jgi:opacity protein-like surface antigen